MIRSIAFGLSLLSSAATFAQMLPAPIVVPGVPGVPVVGTVHINQPGVYGRIDIGQAAPPPVLYAQPVQVMPAPVAVAPRPVYLYVPPGHAKDWRRWCGHYNACGEPVYFVQERWVKARYEEARHRGWEREHDHGRGHDHDHDHDHDD